MAWLILLAKDYFHLFVFTAGYVFAVIGFLRRGLDPRT